MRDLLAVERPSSPAVSHPLEPMVRHLHLPNAWVRNPVLDIPVEK